MENAELKRTIRRPGAPVCRRAERFTLQRHSQPNRTELFRNPHASRDRFLVEWLLFSLFQAVENETPGNLFRFTHFVSCEIASLNPSRNFVRRGEGPKPVTAAPFEPKVAHYVSIFLILKIDWTNRSVDEDGFALSAAAAV